MATPASTGSLKVAQPTNIATTHMNPVAIVARSDCLLLGAEIPATTTNIAISPAGMTFAMTIRLYWTS